MKKQLFSTYTNTIENIINKKSTLGRIDERFFSFTGEEADLIKAFLPEESIIKPETGLRVLADLLGIKVIKEPLKGDHPDFKHLRLKRGVENHYIVSVFIDVKNSTKLHYHYDLDQISLILQTIITAATQTCALFDGHIQRIQGDGVLVYFGGKKVSREEAMKQAVNAAAFFSYFVKYELSEQFKIEDINRIFTRVGIDFGDDDTVQWAVFGLPNCDELTTNSLHTSLPAKMQSNAGNNGIVIGQNVCERLKIVEHHSDFFRDSNGNIDKEKQYVFKKPDGTFNYVQKNFKWEAYLKNVFDFVKYDEQGKLYIDDEITNSDQKESGRVKILMSQNEMMKERQSVFNQNTKSEIPIKPHNFHSDVSKQC